MYIIMCTMCTVHFMQTFTFPLGRNGIVCIWYIIRVYARSYRSPRCHITLLLCYHPVNTVIECTRLQKLLFFLFPEPYSIYDGHSAYTITVLGFQTRLSRNNFPTQKSPIPWIYWQKTNHNVIFMYV